MGSRIIDKALLVNHVLIALFAISSGGFKLLGGQADIEVFSHLGMTAPIIAVFGAIQLIAGIATFPARTRVLATWVLAACNAFATVGLFAASQTAFGAVSIVFVAMALLVLARSPERTAPMRLAT